MVLKRAYFVTLTLVFVLVVAGFVIGACGSGSETTTTVASPSTTAAPTDTSAAAGRSVLILASTTSTQDSGLFDGAHPRLRKRRTRSTRTR